MTKLSAKFEAPLANVRSNAKNEASSFKLLVASCATVKGSKLALAAFDAEYLIGRVAASIMVEGDNRTDEQLFAAADDLINLKPAKTEKRPNGTMMFLPDAKQPDGHRTGAQQRILGAARKSLVLVHREAGIKAKRGGGRAARPPSNESEPPVNALFASPKFDNDDGARDYVRNAFAALLTTCEVNKQTGSKKDVKHVVFLVESIIADAKVAIEKALA